MRWLLSSKQGFSLGYFWLLLKTPGVRILICPLLREQTQLYGVLLHTEGMIVFALASPSSSLIKSAHIPPSSGWNIFSSEVKLFHTHSHTEVEVQLPHGMLLVRIRATGAVKSTPDEMTCSPLSAPAPYRFAHLCGTFSPHAAAAAAAATAVTTVLWSSFLFKVHIEVHASVVLILLKFFSFRLNWLILLPFRWRTWGISL